MARRLQLPSRQTLRKDATAGLVLGVQSVPDGLATGILAGVNPLAGLNAYLVGTVTGAVFASSTYMVVQGTGAMAMIISDVPEVQQADSPDRAVFTLALLTGGVMLVAGLLKLGSTLRFVSNAVMVGFMNAVGVSIALASWPTSPATAQTARTVSFEPSTLRLPRPRWTGEVSLSD